MQDEEQEDVKKDLLSTTAYSGTAGILGFATSNPGLVSQAAFYVAKILGYSAALAALINFGAMGIPLSILALVGVGLASKLIEVNGNRAENHIDDLPLNDGQKATVTGVGTSSPEAFASSATVINGDPAAAATNIVGSNLINNSGSLFFHAHSVLQSGQFRFMESPDKQGVLNAGMSLALSGLLAYGLMSGFGLIFAGVALASLAFYIKKTMDFAKEEAEKRAQQEAQAQANGEGVEQEHGEAQEDITLNPQTDFEQSTQSWKAWLGTGLGIAGLIAAASLLVTSGATLATLWMWGPIALGAIYALGTSVPELFAMGSRSANSTRLERQAQGLQGQIDTLYEDETLSPDERQEKIDKLEEKRQKALKDARGQRATSSGTASSSNVFNIAAVGFIMTATSFMTQGAGIGALAAGGLMASPLGWIMLGVLGTQALISASILLTSLLSDETRQKWEDGISNSGVFKALSNAYNNLGFGINGLKNNMRSADKKLPTSADQLSLSLG